MPDSWIDGPLLDVAETRRRLNLIIPSELDPQGYLTREMTAKTVFVMLYGYAIEDYDCWIRPTAVVDMSDAQAGRQSPDERKAWLSLVQSPRRPKSIEDRWYSENTREPIRDETLRSLVEIGAVVERQGLPTTSPKPRYALEKGFAGLLDPTVSDEQFLSGMIEKWQETHLSKSALARLQLLQKGAVANTENVLVNLPNGEVRRLAPGPSSELTKAVVEEMAIRICKQAAVVMISESAQKLSYEARDLSEAIGFTIDVSKTLPDIILADVGADPPRIIFVECVATDGAISERRKSELEELAVAAGFDPGDCIFITAFHDRSHSAYKKSVSALAWDTAVWFRSEPENIICLIDGMRDSVWVRHLSRR